jgi:hypothetical protein
VVDRLALRPTTSRRCISLYNKTSLLIWLNTVAEQYRIRCGELEARPGIVIKKFFFTKMCNSMRKPTGNSGDPNDFTAKCQSLHRLIYQTEEGDTFGDESDGDYDPIPAEQLEEDFEDGSVEDEELPITSQSSEVTSHETSTSMKNTGGESIVKPNPFPNDTKSKNAKPTGPTRLTLVSGFIIIYHKYNIYMTFNIM